MERFALDVSRNCRRILHQSIYGPLFLHYTLWSSRRSADSDEALKLSEESLRRARQLKLPSPSPGRSRSPQDWAQPAARARGRTLTRRGT